MTFAEWALTDAEKCVLAELKAWDGSEEITLKIATRDIFDYEDRLIDPLIIRRSMNWAGGSAEATVGAISIDNSDRDKDAWIDYGWHGRDVVIKLGDPSWDEDDARWSVRFRGLANKMEAEDNVLTLFTRDKSEKLNRPIIERPLNMHPDAFLESFPVCFGPAKNVTPPKVASGSEDDYIIGSWDSSTGGDSVDTVYENGVATAKSLDKTLSGIGGGTWRFRFDVNSPEGTVTCDVFGANDDPVSGGNKLTKPGEIVKYAFTYQTKRESGIALSGSTTTVQMDTNASSEDDFYNGKQLVVFQRNTSDIQDFKTVSDYDGATRTATISGTFSFAVSAGDRYDIEVDNLIRQGPLTDDDIDTDSFDVLDVDAPYELAIWVPDGQMTYIELLDRLLPDGFIWFWKNDGSISVGLLKDPSEDSSVFVIDQYETRGKIRIIQEDVPIYRVRVGFDRNWTPMTTPSDTASTDRVGFLNREHIWEIDEDLGIKDSFSESVPKDYTSFLTTRSHAQTEAERILALRGVQRKRIMVEGLSGLFSVGLNDVVTLKDDTYDLEDGQDFRVVMMEERPISGTIDVELWG